MNSMQKTKMEKVTLNIGVGAAGERLENAYSLLQRISGEQPVYTKAKNRNPAFKVKKGENIGAKVTIRGEKAAEVLKKLLETVDRIIPSKSFDRFGNVAFGVKEYIDIPGMKYDPKIGMMGLDVCITLTKPGKRVAVRRRAPSQVHKKQMVSQAEAKAFMQEKFGATIAEPEKKE